MVNVPRSAIANYERGAYRPSLDVLVRLADCLGVSLDYLVGREDAIVAAEATARYNVGPDPEHVAEVLAEMETLLKRLENLRSKLLRMLR
jgi:transcriptional regulator with XRE-family HTH domain